MQPVLVGLIVLLIDLHMRQNLSQITGTRLPITIDSRNDADLAFIKARLRVALSFS